MALQNAFIIIKCKMIVVACSKNRINTVIYSERLNSLLFCIHIHTRWKFPAAVIIWPHKGYSLSYMTWSWHSGSILFQVLPALTYTCGTGTHFLHSCHTHQVWLVPRQSIGGIAVFLLWPEGYHRSRHTPPSGCMPQLVWEIPPVGHKHSMQETLH